MQTLYITLGITLGLVAFVALGKLAGNVITAMVRRRFTRTRLEAVQNGDL